MKLTELEVELLNAIGNKSAYDPITAYSEKVDNEGEFKGVRWLDNDNALLGQFFVALNALYPDSIYYVTQTGILYVFKQDEASDPMQYIAKNFNKHRKSVVDVNGYIQSRWNSTYSSMQRLNTLLIDIVSHDDRFSIKPFMKAVELRAEQVKNGERQRVSIEDFNNLFEISDPAPYQMWALELLIKSPLVSQSGKGFSENMIILAGKQGIGKSYLVHELSLGYSTVIKYVSRKDQETLTIRNENVFLESAELANMKKSDVESIKSAITTHSSDFLPKYSNERKTLDLPAVLLGTTNKYSILKDITGERRFLPLPIDNIKHGFDTEFFLDLYASYWLDMQASGDYNLYKSETDEDLDYKRELFGQIDSELGEIEKWLKGNLESLTVKEDGEYVYLENKSTVEELFASDTRNSDSGVYRIYSGKLYEYLVSKGCEATQKKINGKNKRWLRVPKSAFAWLGVDTIDNMADIF